MGQMYFTLKMSVSYATSKLLGGKRFNIMTNLYKLQANIMKNIFMLSINLLKLYKNSWFWGSNIDLIDL